MRALHPFILCLFGAAVVQTALKLSGVSPDHLTWARALSPVWLPALIFLGIAAVYLATLGFVQVLVKCEAPEYRKYSTVIYMVFLASVWFSFFSALFTVIALYYLLLK